MATKTITIMDDVYELLVRNKRKDESFSDMLRKDYKKKGNISDCAGLWADMPDEEFNQIKEGIKEIRKLSAKSFLKRHKK